MPAPDPSKLDLPQILQRVYDEVNGRLRTDAVIDQATVNVQLDPNDDGVFVADQTTGHKLTVNADGSINVILTGSLDSTTPSIQNVAITTSGVENVLILPINTKQFQLRVRDSLSKIQIAYVLGESNSSYITIPRGCNYSQDNLNLTTFNRVLFIQSNKDNIVLECAIWT